MHVALTGLLSSLMELRCIINVIGNTSTIDQSDSTFRFHPSVSTLPEVLQRNKMTLNSVYKTYNL